VVDRDVTVGQLSDVIKKTAGDCLMYIRLFDIYTGDQIHDGKKSCAFTLEFMSEDHTLTQQEVETFMQHVIQALESEFHASIRK
jgi:phenylalanyl-tRNA synthetase beta chain